MKNKWKACIATGLAAITATSFFGVMQANAEEEVTTVKFSSEIVAVSPRINETVSIVHSGMESVLNIANVSSAEVGKYYYFTPDMRAFNEKGLPSTQEEIRACYDNNDDFAPVNNLLEWAYEAEADSYTVSVALDKKFTQVVFTDTVEENFVNLGNTLYAGTN